ncbi:C10 family peptidase [Porphyromonas levii]|uniref:C10 family peptidase n=1 Tax=Porphyromonas levii TaxID=28114 RepID=UPI0009FBAD17|nr:C10 family peptidase [Porphyromonas levii]
MKRRSFVESVWASISTLGKKLWRGVVVSFTALVAIFAVSCSNQSRMSDIAEATSGDADAFVSELEAQKIAENFLKVNDLRSGGEQLTLVYTEPSNLRANDGTEYSDLPAYYVYNIGDKGFIIVSASETTYPVLGYSEENTFAVGDQMPDNLKAVLKGYADEIRYSWKNIKSTDATKQWREGALRSVNADEATTRVAAASVKPLLGTIKWNQAPYYNDLCPTGTPVGCVATATSQIMRYWEYPSRGRGSHTSTVDGRSVNFDHPLNWSNMPKATLRSPNRDVAQLCYDVAIGLNMQFSRKASGTYQRYIPDLLVNHYYYDTTVRQLYRNTGYSASQWHNILREELSAGRPVQYAGSGRGGGHSFVCDGYDSRGYFSFNWGWGGSSDGYFLTNALNPGSLGIGGGSGGFNYYQDIIIGIQPRGNVTPSPDPDQPTYPISYARDSYYAFISGVGLNRYVANSRTGSGYADYTTIGSFPISRGNNTITLTPGFGTTNKYNNYWRVWIDFNNDGVFSRSEMIVNTSSSQVVSGQFSLSNNLQSGSYRMRVSMKTYDGYPAPDEIFTYGEVEDYSVVVR